jgi:hypothetical protein
MAPRCGARYVPCATVATNHGLTSTFCTRAERIHVIAARDSPQVRTRGGAERWALYVRAMVRVHRRHGESHSPVVRKLWVLEVAGSNPASPTNHQISEAVLMTSAEGLGPLSHSLPVSSAIALFMSAPVACT